MAQAQDAPDNVELGAQTAPDFDCEADSFRFIRDLIRKHEGRSCTPYIPPIGKSSATISTGLDLGQHSVASLRAMQIQEEVVQRLAPLAGKSAAAARPLLATGGFTLTPEENDAVEEAIVRHFIRTTATAYDEALRRAHADSEKNSAESMSMNSKPHSARRGDSFVPAAFAKLPKELQAPVVSVLFQHGRPKAVPRFWRCVTSGNWMNAVTEMRHFYTRPTPLLKRREQEADVLLIGIGRLVQAECLA